MMEKKDTGGPAFPAHHFDMTEGEHGMDLRDFFAAKALTGMLGSRNPNTPRFHPEDDAAYVYAVADAMLKARKA
jgi:hypothetical protein